MKRLFPEVIEAYNNSESYDEYDALLPTLQEFFRKVSNKKALEAGVKLNIIAKSRKSSNKKKIILLRKIMNLFRSITPRRLNHYDEPPFGDSIFYGLFGNAAPFPERIWIEYWSYPLDVMMGMKICLEEDDPYEVAMAIADYYRQHRWVEFCELTQKNQRCIVK